MRVRPNLTRKEIALTVAVVICTRNRPALLRNCLAAVAKLNPRPDDVLVVDNSTGDKETEQIAAAFSARYTVEPQQGLSRARNRGLAECNTEIVAFLDDDALPDPLWLGTLLAAFADTNISATTGRVITPETQDEIGQESPRFLSNKDPLWFEIVTFGGLGIGSNMALRKAACAGWTIFDERLGRGAPLEIGEETYAFAALLSRGHTAAYLPSAVVFHPPLRREAIETAARNSMAYWLLLFSEFPANRIDLLRFLFKRLRRQRLTWPRQTQEPGEIINSSLPVKLKAGLSGVLRFLSTRKPPGN